MMSTTLSELTHAKMPAEALKILAQKYGSPGGPVEKPIPLTAVVNLAGLAMGLLALSKVPNPHANTVASRFTHQTATEVLPIFEAVWPENTWVRSGLGETPTSDYKNNLSGALSGKKASPDIFALEAIYFWACGDAAQSASAAAWAEATSKLTNPLNPQNYDNCLSLLKEQRKKQQQTLIDMIGLYKPEGEQNR